MCTDKLENGNKVTTVTRGIGTLISTSIQRKDGNAKLLENLTSITVHVKCRERYTMVQDKKLRYKNVCPNTTDPAPTKFPYSPPKKKLRMSDEKSFCFENDCFLCGLPADEKSESKKKSHLQRKIIYVTKAETQQHILHLISVVFNEETKNILKRISLIDLISVKGKYHKDCYSTKLINPSNGVGKSCNPVGRPVDNRISENMNIIYNYIDNSNDFQFSLQELIDLLGNIK